MRYNLKPTFPILQKGNPLVRGLIGAWIFFEAKGNKAFDLSGNKNHGTLMNMPTSAWVSSVFGGSLDFSGSDDHVTVGNYILTKISVSIWVKFHGLAVNQSIISAGPVVARGDWNIRKNNITNKISFGLHNGGNWVGSTFDTGVVIDKWYHIVATWDNSGDAGNVRIYQDGVPASIFGSGVTGSTAPEDWVVGARGATVDPLNGQIDDVRVYNRVLSAKEIKQIYRNPWSIYRPKKQFDFVNEQIIPSGFARSFGQII